MKFLIMQTDLDQPVLGSYFRSLGFFVLSDEKKMILFLPHSLLPEESKKRKLVARGLEGFAKSLLFGNRPKLDVFIGKNKVVECFVLGYVQSHDLKELVSFYGEKG